MLDEVVFTLRVPASVPVYMDQETVPTGSDADTSNHNSTRVLRLQRQPSALAFTTAAPRASANPRTSSSRSSSSKPQQQAGFSETARDNQKKERVSLLTAEETDDLEVSSLESPPPVPAGWTLASPFWSLQSDHLLTVTYCPAWQAIPEYTASTKNSYCRCSTSWGCCNHTCCNDGRGDVFVQETFTSQHVQAVRRVSRYYVPGIGDCQAVELHLRPMHTDAISAVPAYLQAAWQRHVHRMKTNRQALQEQGVEIPGSTISSRPLSEGPVLIFCLPNSPTQQHTALLWKVELPALQQPISVETLTVLNGSLLQAPPLSSSSSSSQHEYDDPIHSAVDPTHIFIHGFQSWSFTGSLVKGRKQPKSALPDVFSRAFNHGGSPPPLADPVAVPLDDDHVVHSNPVSSFVRHYQSDFFTCITSDAPPAPRPPRQLRQKHQPPPPQPYQLLDETGGPALMLGWLSQYHQFGVINANQDLTRFQMHCSAHGQVLLGTTDQSSTTTTTAILPTRLETDWAYAQLVAPHLYDEEPMVHYLHAAAAFNQARPLQNGSLLTGWCSWYVFYEKITAKLLRENVVQLARSLRKHVPTNVAVVDDGYMTAWGDWGNLKPKAFPGDGLHAASRDISNNGMRPGLWLAPFAADKHSQLAKNHPDWIIKSYKGAASNSSHCGKFFFGLDATNPQVRGHVYEAINRAVEDWEYNVLKIDFLYAACLEGNGKFDLSMSRAQAMHVALCTIRDAAGPDVFLIGCGCPIASGIGYVDAMRVSADTGPTWYPASPLPFWDNGTLPALRSMVRNSIARAPMGHRWWHNDPDCLMLGEHTRLTNEEVASAASVVAMTCGMLLLSDDLPKVNPARLQIVSKIFPLTGVPAVVLDLHSTNDGLPSLMRLWCTDKFNLLDSFRDSMSVGGSDDEIDHNAEATFFARHSSFRHDEDNATSSNPNERQRSCIHVTKGLGTWTVVSISNWLDKPAVVHVPPPALLPPPDSGWNINEPDDFMSECGDHGYHAFGFWSSKYSWLPDHRRPRQDSPEQTISKKLNAHETEIFHIKPVTPEQPQYIGSDFHFSCGKEVRTFRATKDTVSIFLDTMYYRVGHVFVFLPRIDTNSVKVTVNKETARWDAVGNTPRLCDNGTPRLAGRVIRIKVAVHADGRPGDGSIRVEF